MMRRHPPAKRLPGGFKDSCLAALRARREANAGTALPRRQYRRGIPRRVDWADKGCMLCGWSAMPDKREIWFHEDDYGQQLLPGQVEVAKFVQAELRKSSEFAEAHRAPGGMGWTDVYVIEDPPLKLRELKIQKEEVDAIVSGLLPRFDAVRIGYGSHGEPCRRTAAWGRTAQCALLADWDEAGVISTIWAQLFDGNEQCILAAAKAVAAIGTRYNLLYVDWAWNYMCDASDPVAFASMLRSKLDVIASRAAASEGR